MTTSALILLRPQLLGYRNRVFRSGVRGFRFELLVLLAVSGVMAGLFMGFSGAITLLLVRGELSGAVLYRLLSAFFLAFLLLLAFSSFVTALSSLYGSKDLPLLLAAPVTPGQFFLSKFVEVLAISSWMFAVLALPIFAALDWSLGTGGLFFFEATAVSLLFLFIPTAIGILLATVFVNLFPLHRVGDTVVIIVLILVSAFLFFGQEVPSSPAKELTLQEFAREISQVDKLNYAFLPSTWAAGVLARYLPASPADPVTSLFLLFGVTALFVASAILLLRSYFLPGFGRTLESGPVGKLKVLSAGFELPIAATPLRAIIGKEFKLFFRDSTQALQLLLILLLTVLYLYNFRSLQALSSFGEETKRWWEAVLSLANIFMGASVAAAISTRFVYPSVSLEGRAYSLVRNTPISIEEFLRGKYLAWFVPILVLSEVLLVSGALAVNASPSGILVTAVIALALSMGTVGLGIGIGAVYGKFDWDSSAQVTSNFGSLIYMLLSIVLIILSMVPGGYLFIVVSVPNMTVQTPGLNQLLSQFCAFALIFFINLGTSRMAMNAGVEALKDLER